MSSDPEGTLRGALARCYDDCPRRSAPPCDQCSATCAALCAGLGRLADQILRLARRRPGEPCDAAIRIVYPSTRRFQTIPNAVQELLDGALALARRGWRVFPVVASHIVGDARDGKIPLIKKWPERATTDPTQIRAWWGVEFRGANVGIACGEGSNLTVIDLDHRPDEGKDGREELTTLVEAHGDIPDGPCVNRGTSFHLYFARVPELRSVNGVLPGIDIKTDGGFVIAPPSIHRFGDRYGWISKTRDLPLPTMPAWLVEKLKPLPKPQRARTHRANVLDHVTEGVEGTSAIGIECVDALRPGHGLRGKINVDEVLEAFGLPCTPSVCPLHDGADNPGAFQQYADGWRWRCWTRWTEHDDSGLHDGDVIDLIRRLNHCNYAAACAFAERVINGDIDE